MLLDSPDEGVLYLAAIQKNASLELLIKLSQYSSLRIKKGVSWNLHTPPNVLQSMSEMGNISINCNLATNPNTPLSVLLELAKSSNRILMPLISCNPSTPATIREALIVSYSGYHPKPKEGCWKKNRQIHW